MSRNKNKQNKGTTVSDTNNNNTTDLTNALGNLGDILKGAQGVEGGTGSKGPEGIGEVLDAEPGVDNTVSATTVVANVDVPVANVLAEAAEAAAVVVADTAPVTDFATQVKVNMAPHGDTSRVRIQKAVFDTYVEAVAPGIAINWDTMTKQHAKLCKALIESAGYPYIEFKEVYDYLLKLVKEHRAKAFSDIYVRRFDDRLYPIMTKDQIIVADRLLSIITTVGRHNDRSRALQQIDLAASLKDVKPALAQQNLSAYFGSFRR